jgi:phage-related protein (TIGR01555 family)
MSKNKNKIKPSNSRELNTNTNQPVQYKEKLNALTELALGFQTQQNQISQSDTVDVNLRRYMISQNRMLLSYLYVEIGIIQTLIDQPVDDAFAKMPIMQSNAFNDQPEKIEEVQQYIQEHGWFEVFKQALKWQRLYGGSGIMINVPQNPQSQFRIDRVNQNTPIEFYALDRWELNYKPSGEITPENMNVSQPMTDTPYDIYGETFHKSRVLPFKGKEAPSILKLQLMGWGMSEVERMIRSLNSFLKNQDVIFELLDEAKIDVFKVFGFQDAVMGGQEDKVVKQVTAMNMIKNYNNAIVMDKEDEYDQKTMQFTGLNEMLSQIREGIAADLKMPVTKLWGVSSAGFNSGEDDIENYNSMLESEIRIKSRQNLIMIYKIACQVVHGFIPEDIDLEYPPLRVLTSEQEQTVKDKQFARLLQTWQAQLISDEDFINAVNKANLLPNEIQYNKKGILSRIKESMSMRQPQKQQPTDAKKK